MLSSACPSVYHEFEGPEPIPYDTEGLLYFIAFYFTLLKFKTFFLSGTDRGNNYKVTQHS